MTHTFIVATAAVVHKDKEIIQINNDKIWKKSNYNKIVNNNKNNYKIKRKNHMAISNKTIIYWGWNHLCKIRFIKVFKT